MLNSTMQIYSRVVELKISEEIQNLLIRLKPKRNNRKHKRKQQFSMLKKEFLFNTILTNYRKYIERKFISTSKTNPTT